MASIRFPITVLFLTFFSAGFLVYGEETNKDIYKTLDKMIADKQRYDEQKEEKIHRHKDMLRLKELSKIQEFEINDNLSKEYFKYKLDSAIFYGERNLQIAKELHRDDLVNASKIQLSMYYSTSGMYIEAQEILKSINRETMEQNLLPEYYYSVSQFYGHYSQSNNNRKYMRLNEAYRDSLLSVLSPDSQEYQFTYAEKILYQGQIDIAEKRLLSLLSKTPEEDKDYAFITYLLGYLYKQKQKDELQKYYFALSAIADIKNAIKDNASLQSLALAFYESGDIDRAYRYMKSAIDDAVSSNVRFRTIEISEFYTVINTAYVAKEKKQKRTLQTLIFSISLVSLFLILSIIYVYKQKNRVARIRKELYRTNVRLTELNEDITRSNEQLHEVNAKLSDSNHIKEEYIAHFFNLLSSSINRLENYRKSLLKKAMNNQLDEVVKSLRSTSLTENQLEDLYLQFDSTFLNLYPSFVEQFNALLIKEEQITLKPGELLNTELRIYALIRLGITDSVKIAEFLRYSVSTIYNYRTKARNKAAVSRKKFEEMVMEIDSYAQE